MFLLSRQVHKLGMETDAAANFTIADYLKSWGLEVYIEKFIENSIDLETLQMLSDADLRELVPVIGHRAKLATQIKLLNQIMSNAFTTQQSNVNQILKDFKVMYPSEYWKFDENWLSIRPKLIDMVKRKGLPTNIDESTGEETLDMVALTSLPFMMNTCNVTSAKKNSKKTWRPSKQEVLEGFITHVTSPSEI